MGKFLDHVAALRLGGCFALTLLGLRREEVGGLRWSDINLDAGALRIRQARVDVNGRDTVVATKDQAQRPRSAAAATRAGDGQGHADAPPPRAPGRGPATGGR
jgi:integrase